MLLKAVSAAAQFLTPLFLLAAAIWAWRDARTLKRQRRMVFVAGILSSSLAYAVHFLLRSYLRGAHLNYWAEVDTTVGIGGLMFLATMLGFIGGCFGKSYGRLALCAASVLVGLMWWLTGVASF